MSGGIVTAMGLASAVLSLQTKLTVEATDPIVAGDPLSTQFQVKNDSLWPLHWTHHSCHIVALVYEDGREERGYRSFPAIPLNRTYWPGEGRPLACFWLKPEGAQLKSADIELEISYTPWLLPWELSHTARFYGTFDNSKRLRWFRVPRVDRS